MLASRLGSTPSAFHAAVQRTAAGVSNTILSRPSAANQPWAFISSSSWPAPDGYRLQGLEAGGQPEALVDEDRVLDLPFGRMEDEAALRLARAAVVDRRVGRLADVEADVVEQLVKAQPGMELADANAERAVPVMDAQRDHRMVEPRVAHPGHRQQQPAGEVLHIAHRASG